MVGQVEAGDKRLLRPGPTKPEERWTSCGQQVVTGQGLVHRLENKPAGPEPIRFADDQLKNILGQGGDQTLGGRRR